MAQNSESQRENPENGPGKRGGYFGTPECGWDWGGRYWQE